jgi:(E)-4-hydroxy-3-methyl-but-2-enyl pyrophosphate reductase
MKVQVAEKSGFCFGVRRAVDMAEQTLASLQPLYALGDIIHNVHVVDKLAGMGLVVCENPEEVPPDSAVLIRAHGVPKEIYDMLRRKNCRIIDATCPFVSKIHQIVKKESENGSRILIFGNPKHPEVMGISGWCKNSFVFESFEVLSAFVKNAEISPKETVCVVSQTTANREKWNFCTDFIKKSYTNRKIFDTICNATDERQMATRRIAGEVELMVVVGDKKSSNTKRLYEISKSLCPKVLFVEDASELQGVDNSEYSSIGITAGASTPEWIIKEVINTMSEEIKNESEDFAALLDQSIKTLNTGDKVTGTVMSIGEKEVEVDLGVKHAAYIPTSELSDDPNYDVNENLHVGDEVEVIVVRVNDAEGTVTLSKKRVDAMREWENIEKARDEKTILEGVVIEENRGGVVATVNGVRVFIPASHTGLPRGAAMSELLKQTVKFRITEINRQRKRVVGSIRSVLQEERRKAAEKIWETIEVGQEYEGTVKSLTSFGAFVDIGGVDGMVHISELSWGRIKHPSEVVNIGDTVKVHVIGLDKENKKISLGYRKEEDNPWNIFTAKYAIGDTAPVKILKFMPFGAFAEIVPGVDGLIHISQIANKRIAKPEDVLTAGEVVDAKIIDIDDEKKKVSLSIRALLNEDDETDAE